MSVAKSIVGLVPFWRMSQARTILDYGAGNLRNSRYLAEAGFNLIIVEISDKWRRMAQALGLTQVFTPSELLHSKLKVDVVIVNFVFNLIESKSEEQRVIGEITEVLRDQGYLLIEVRNWLFNSSGHNWIDHHLRPMILQHRYSVITEIHTQSSSTILFQKSLTTGGRDLLS